jgi:cholest-5-ene-3beta,7alpha-diol 3beta-dehydrogenase
VSFTNGWERHCLQLTVKQLKILITGSTGAIGLAMLQQLKVSNDLQGVSVLVRNSKKNKKILRPFADQITIHYGDLLERSSLIPACKNQDLVIHLAGIIPPAYHENNDLGWKVNVGGTKNVIEVMEEYAPKAFLLFSSSVVVYGDRIATPEISTTDPLDHEQEDGYGRAKVACEKMIQESSLRWGIYRVTGVMGVRNHKISAIMFHVPMATRMEIVTVRDAANAFIQSAKHLESLDHKIFNFGGGKACFLTYREFLTRSFASFGLGQLNFPDDAFATCNFHLGEYTDSDELEKILHFRSDSVDSYFKHLQANIPWIQRIATRPFAWFIKRYLLSLSEPLKARKTKNKTEMERFFGKTNEG